MKIVLLGPPGAGKGTQASILSEEMGVPRVSSGDLFRDHQGRGTELGRLAKTYMERGTLVPDEVTIRMVMEWVDAHERAFLLDGFPRTRGQAEALDEAMADKSGIDVALSIRVDREELVRRLTGRLICRGCQATYHRTSSPPSVEGRCGECGGELYQRQDDSPEAVVKRLEVYFEETEPLIGYYRQTGILREVDGEGPIDEIKAAIAAALN